EPQGELLNRPRGGNPADRAGTWIRLGEPEVAVGPGRDPGRIIEQCHGAAKLIDDDRQKPSSLQILDDGKKREGPREVRSGPTGVRPPGDTMTVLFRHDRS